MDTRIIKSVLAVAILAWAVQQFVAGNIVSGIFIVLLAAIVVLLLFRSVRLIIAFFQLRKQDTAKAQQWLGRVNPDKLWKRQQAYYYFLKGLSRSENESLGTSEKHFKKALNIGLKMDHDKAVAKLNLAMIAMNKRRKREATTLLSEVKKLDKRNMLREQVKMAKDAMKRL